MAYRFIPGFFLCLGSLGFASPSRTGLSTAADSCGPAFARIYDFQVGDVFQDWQSSGSFGAASYSSTKTAHRKYAIVSKEILANGYRYRISGKIHQVTKSGSMLPSAPPGYFEDYYGELSESWEILDTAGLLNACKDRMVRVQLVPGSLSTFYTRVKIAVGDVKAFPIATDSTRLKILGAPDPARPGENLYSDSAGKNPVEGMPQYYAYYAAGLGCVGKKFAGGEVGWESRLEGHARGRDTLGSISPDESFLPPPASRTRIGPARPKTARIAFDRGGLLFGTPDGRQYRDARGNLRRIGLPLPASR